MANNAELEYQELRERYNRGETLTFDWCGTEAQARKWVKNDLKLKGFDFQYVRALNGLEYVRVKRSEVVH